MSVALALLLAANLRETLGVFERWGAFRDSVPVRCYAIAEPLGQRTTQRPFASIAAWPGARVRHQLHVRLSRDRAPSARVTLSIGERRFELIAGDDDAWAPDDGTDAAILVAIRSGRSMSVETVSARGAPFADIYPLRGAATAVDAAMVGCAGR